MSFEIEGRQSYGIWQDENTWFEVPPYFLEKFPDLKSVIAANQLNELDSIIRESGKAVQIDKARYLPVIPNPGKIFCVGLNYKTHVAEMKRQDSDYPAIFVRFADSLTSHQGTLPKPKSSNRFDYEGELAVIIGKGGRYISQEESWNHIAGYACFNDASVRDWQRHTHQWTPGKNCPLSGPFGPFMKTRDAIADVDQLTLETRLNGQVMQHASLSDLIFTLPVIIEYVSSFTSLSPGDVIATGTPGGVGDKREPAIYMKAGDLIEVQITDLGTLRNIVSDEE